MAVKLDMKSVLLVNSFESSTGATVKDMFNDAKGIVFVVAKGDVGKAVGKQGKNIKYLSSKLKKDVRVVEYSSEKLEFIRNLIFPVRAKNVHEEDDIVVIEVQDRKSKGLLIGRNASTLRSLEEIVRRHFPVKEIKVI
jgi:transcription termination/antitermination protein NusA